MPVTQRIERLIYPNRQSSEYKNKLSISYDFLETMGIDLVEENDLNRYSVAIDMNHQPVLINETVVEKFRWLEKPIEKTFEGDSKDVRVVGVVLDFHYDPVKSRIKPMKLAYTQPESAEYLFINTETSDIRSTIDRLEDIWHKIGTGATLIYSFLDSAYQNPYLAEDRLASIFNYFSVLTIAITCLGCLDLLFFLPSAAPKRSVFVKCGGLP